MKFRSIKRTFVNLLREIKQPERPEIDPEKQVEPKDIELVHHCCYLSKLIYDRNAFINDIYGTIIYSTRNLIVLNSKVLDRIFVVFKGTSDIHDALTHTRFVPSKYDDGYIHLGTKLSAEKALMHIGDYLRNISQSLKRPIVVTGHSIGGGIAGVFCLAFRKMYNCDQIRSITFSSNPVVDRNLHLESRDFNEMYFLGDDIVPFLSISNIKKIRIIARITKSMNMSSCELFPVGRCYHIQKDSTIVEIEDVIKYFSDIYDKINVKDHLVCSVLDAISAITEERDGDQS